jgi:flagellum-specific peptidoglycan hydrolase FlgJ
VTNIVKSNDDRNKAAPLKDESQAAEDGPLKEMPATGDKGPVDTTINEGPGKVGGPLKVADGPVRDGTQAMQYLKLAPNVKMEGMNPALKQQLLAMIQEYGERTGKSVTLNAAVRDTAEQEKLFRQNPKKAARPGTSLHEYGLAVDANSGDLDAMDELGLMRKYGFTRPVGGEPWHAEAAGIQTNIKLAKNDPSFASQAIGASLNKGGGGVGSIRGTPLGKRDTMFAMGQMGVSAQKVADKGTGETDKDKVASLAGGAALVSANDAPPAPKPVSAAVPIAAPVAMKTPVQVAANDAPKAAAKATTVQTAYQQSDKYNAAAKMPDMEAKPKEETTGADTKSSGPYAEVKDRVTKVARQEGVPPQEMLTFAATESGLNPNARAPVGTSAGLFGFTKASWGQQVQEVGPRMSSNPQRYRRSLGLLQDQQAIHQFG